MTASHGGFFRLCKLNSSSQIATQDCFDQNVLKISPINNSMDNWHTAFYGNSYQGTYIVNNLTDQYQANASVYCFLKQYNMTNCIAYVV